MILSSMFELVLNSVNPSAPFDPHGRLGTYTIIRDQIRMSATLPLASCINDSFWILGWMEQGQAKKVVSTGAVAPPASPQNHTR